MRKIFILKIKLEDIIVITKTVTELSLMELNKSARVMQRQLKLIRGMNLSQKDRDTVKEILELLEKEINLFRV